MLEAGPLNGKSSSIIDLSDEVPEVIREGAGDISMFE
jgi:tRNA A37 threonylcarbamoyladenosine synthetase subunit TsaC/SUA5/YrdC